MRETDVASVWASAVAVPCDCVSAHEAPEIFKISSANNYELVVLLLRLPLINAAARPLIGRQTLFSRPLPFGVAVAAVA